MSITVGMERLLEGVRQNKFLVIGRAGIDFFTDPGIATEDAERMNVSLGGSAANTAVGICKLGGKAALVTRVSDDNVGRYCVGQLKRYGVATNYVTSIGGEFRNSLSVYETRFKDHNTVIYRNGAADFQMSEEDIAAVDFASFGAVITAGTVFAAEPSRGAAFNAFERAKAAGLPIIFDVDYRPYSWPSATVAGEVLSAAAEQSDMVVGNDEEFGFMAGGPEKGLAKARELTSGNERLIIYKMGEKGAVTFGNGSEVRTGIYPVEALKPTGAGDSFMAGVLSSLAVGLSLEVAVLRGSACASVTVSRPGCAPAMPDSQTLEAFLADHPGPNRP